MRIICPYYPEVAKETEEALIDYPVEYIKLNNGLGYYNLLKLLWENPEDVILVEHDVVVYPGAIEALISCQQDYCGYNYEDHGKGVMFGCVKLTKAHMEKLPDLWDSMKLRNWRNVHGHHGNTYIENGIKGHQHYPSIVNKSEST